MRGKIRMATAPTNLAAPAQPPRVNVLGVGLSVINLDSALDAVAAALAAKTPGYVCVTGVHGVMEAQDDPPFRAILNQAFLNTPDGMPMVWMGRLHGYSQMNRVYGPDLMLLVAEFTRTRDYTHFLYGGAEGVAEQLQRNLETKFPGIKIIGTYTPPFRPLSATEEADLVQMLNDKKTGHDLGRLEHSQTGKVHGAFPRPGSMPPSCSVSAPPSTSMPGASVRRHFGCNAAVSNGCSGSAANRAGSGAVTSGTIPSSSSASSAS